MLTSPILARSQAKRQKKFQEGTILSYTILSHPPPAFGERPRTIGLIHLDDGTKVLARVLSGAVIGQRVRPRMQLSCVNAEGLRAYDIAFEPIVPKKVEAPAFPGYLLALTGPSGVGKSTISRLLLRMFAEYVAPVPILTTRQRKKGDDGEYRYISPSQFARLLKKGEIVSSTVIPSSSEKRWYGYASRDIEAIWKQDKLPIVITEMHLLQGLASHFGRRSILSFGLLPPGRSKRAMLSHLLHRLRTRGRDSEEHIRDRLKNAEADLTFLRTRRDLFDHLVVNENLDTVIATLKEHVPVLTGA